MQQAKPDISSILAAKAQRRQALAALSWEEKIAIIEQMRTLLPKGQWKRRTAEQRLADDDRAETKRPLDAPPGTPQ